MYRANQPLKMRLDAKEASQSHAYRSSNSIATPPYTRMRLQASDNGHKLNQSPTSAYTAYTACATSVSLNPLGSLNGFPLLPASTLSSSSLSTVTSVVARI
jgi:hypothetical protein